MANKFTRRSLFKKSFGAVTVLHWAPLFAGMKSNQLGVGKTLLEKDPKDILDLPKGFSYKIVQKSGQLMSDGYRVPGKPDGMALFLNDQGNYVLMRNHELDSVDYKLSAFYKKTAPKEKMYDAKEHGGVSRVVLDSNTLEVLESNMVLAGTTHNCAGGVSPWGWLSCEESVADNHGYVFLCSSESVQLSAPKKIPGYGRFRHEAAVVDTKTNIAYLTEDENDSCFYRFVPVDPRVPFKGELQALKIKGKNRVETTRELKLGRRYDVEWVAVDNPDPKVSNIRYKSQEKGAAIFVRGEGLWQHGNKVYFSCTSGGPVKGGQIFCLNLSESGETESVELVAQSTDRSKLDMPDNITVSPTGKLYLAEDGYRTPYVRAIDSHGRIIDVAKNNISSSEFAGVCFSPDGNHLFVNMQKNGLTLVISGPFDQLVQ